MGRRKLHSKNVEEIASLYYSLVFLSIIRKSINIKYSSVWIESCQYKPKTKNNPQKKRRTSMRLFFIKSHYAYLLLTTDLTVLE